MKIRGNSDKGGKERLGEQENEANRALKPTERGPEMPREERKRAQKGYESHRSDGGPSNFRGPTPPPKYLRY